MKRFTAGVMQMQLKAVITPTGHMVDRRRALYVKHFLTINDQKQCGNPQEMLIEMLASHGTL